MIQKPMEPIAILGAGLAGLTAAVHLKRHGIPVLILESGKEIAGLCKSERDPDGFTYDCGVHFITNRLAAAVGISSDCQMMAKYGETVYLRGKEYSYPLGLIQSPRFAISAAIGKLTALFRKPANTAREHYRNAYGAKLADEVAVPLTEAWSGVDGEHIAAAVGQKFATSLPRVLMLRWAASVTKRVIGIGYSGTITESPNAWHVYPKNGIAAVCAKQAEEVASDIRFESRVESIQVENGRVCSIVCNGETIPVSAVVSTAPVHILAKLVQGCDHLKALQKFRYRAMVFVNLKLHGASGLKDVVTWVPERKFPFFRISDVGMGLPWLVPEGKSQVTCDIGCQVGDEVWVESDEQLTKRCCQGLEEMIPGITARLIGSRVVRVPMAYPIYHLDYERERQEFERGSGIQGLISVGRNGEFAHILMEDVYWRTRWKLSQYIDSLEAKTN